MKHKIIITTLLIFSLCFLFCACQGNEETSYTEEDKGVIAASMLTFEELSRQAGVIPSEELPNYAETIPLDITVRAGVIDFELTNAAIVDTNATATATMVTWDICILNDGSGYQVAMTFNKNTMNAVLSKYDNTWAVSESNITKKEDMPRDIKGTYDTFDEAITAANELDPEKENPFF